jgi:positive regulator of sigma E activity
LVLGDTVRVGVDRSALTRASFAAYALPLITMLIAAGSLQDAGDAIAIVAALVGLAVGAFVAKVVVRRWRDVLVPVVLGRSLTAAGSSCASSTGRASMRLSDIPVIHQRSL